MKRYKCNGGDGCAKSGCEFIAHGQPELKTEKVYMCPFNHWRSCRWKEIKVHSSNAPLERLREKDAVDISGKL